MPVMFQRDESGDWYAKWLHLYTRGSTWGNRIEENRVTSARLAHTILHRRYLTVSYVVGMLGEYTLYTPGMPLTGPVTFLGIDRPADLPEGSDVITLDRLTELIPQ
jgi:hypothetical protein